MSLPYPHISTAPYTSLPIEVKSMHGPQLRWTGNKVTRDTIYLHHLMPHCTAQILYCRFATRFVWFHHAVKESVAGVLSSLGLGQSAFRACHAVPVLNQLCSTIYISPGTLQLRWFWWRFRPIIAAVKTCELSHFSCIQLFATLWTVAHQVALSMGFSRQEYWSGVTFPSPGDFPDWGIEPASPALQTGSLPTKLGSPQGRFAVRLIKHKFQTYFPYLHMLLRKTLAIVWS